MGKNYHDLVQEIKQERSALDARMQEDINLLYLEKFVVRDSAGKVVPDIINVTLNRPAVFAANIISALSKARLQTSVETDDEAIDTAYIEDFLQAAFNSADRRLWSQGLARINPFADTQFCIRGRAARRVLLREEEGG